MTDVADAPDVLLATDAPSASARVRPGPRAPGGVSRAAALLRDADRALYQAKALGRGRAVLFEARGG